MTNHFLRATKRGNPVQLIRTGKRAWSVTAPLPAEVSGPLSKFESTFGYPIDFSCCCTTFSSGSCTCAHDVILEFWTALSEFVLDFADGAGKATAIEPLRRRFVRFYVDLPMWNMSRDPRSVTPKEFRRGLIEDAERMYREASEMSCMDLPWMDWPEHREELTEDDSAELFSSDVSVLSIIRSTVERNFANLLSSSSRSVDHLLASHGPITILQIGSVLDQLNLVELSGDVLEYFERYEQSFVNIVPFSFIKRVNQSLSKRNRMKGRFYNPQMTGRVSSLRSNSNNNMLSKFREKLSRMLLHRRGPREGSPNTFLVKTNKNLIVSSPVEKYWDARRSTQGFFVIPPPLPFPPPVLQISSTDECIQTHSTAEVNRKIVRNASGQVGDPPKSVLSSSGASSVLTVDAELLDEGDSMTEASRSSFRKSKSSAHESLPPDLIDQEPLEGQVFSLESFLAKTLLPTQPVGNSVNYPDPVSGYLKGTATNSALQQPPVVKNEARAPSTESVRKTDHELLGKEKFQDPSVDPAPVSGTLKGTASNMVLQPSHVVKTFLPSQQAVPLEETDSKTEYEQPFVGKEKLQESVSRYMKGTASNVVQQQSLVVKTLLPNETKAPLNVTAHKTDNEQPFSGKEKLQEFVSGYMKGTASNVLQQQSAVVQTFLPNGTIAPLKETGHKTDHEQPFEGKEKLQESVSRYMKGTESNVLQQQPAVVQTFLPNGTIAPLKETARKTDNEQAFSGKVKLKEFVSGYMKGTASNVVQQESSVVKTFLPSQPAVPLEETVSKTEYEQPFSGKGKLQESVSRYMKGTASNVVQQQSSVVKTLLPSHPAVPLEETVSKTEYEQPFVGKEKLQESVSRYMEGTALNVVQQQSPVVKTLLANETLAPLKVTANTTEQEHLVGEEGLQRSVSGNSEETVSNEVQEQSPDTAQPVPVSGALKTIRGEMEKQIELRSSRKIAIKRSSTFSADRAQLDQKPTTSKESLGEIRSSTSSVLIPTPGPSLLVVQREKIEEKDDQKKSLKNVGGRRTSLVSSSSAVVSEDGQLNRSRKIAIKRSGTFSTDSPPAESVETYRTEEEIKETTPGNSLAPKKIKDDEYSSAKHVGESSALSSGIVSVDAELVDVISLADDIAVPPSRKIAIRKSKTFSMGANPDVIARKIPLVAAPEKKPILCEEEKAAEPPLAEISLSEKRDTKKSYLVQSVGQSSVVIPSANINFDDSLGSQPLAVEVSLPPVPDETSSTPASHNHRRKMRIFKPTGPPLVVTHSYVHVPQKRSSPPSSSRATVGFGSSTPASSLEEWESTVKEELDQLINE